jgi:hypothetical protein
MTFEPPAVPPSYTPPQAPIPPVYQQPQHPGYPQQPPQPQQQRHPGYPQQPQQNGQPPRAKNTLGLISAILGASAYVLGFIFTFIQLGLTGSGSLSSYGVVGGAHSVLDALLGLGAIALGVVGYLKGGPSKLFAIVGATLGATLLLNVLNGLIFTIALPLLY